MITINRHRLNTIRITGTWHKIDATKIYADVACLLAGFLPPIADYFSQYLSFPLQFGDLHFQRVSLELSSLQR